MIDVEGLARTLRRLNALRHGAAGPAQLEQLRVLEDALDQLFNAGNALAVYGSLAPGESNHHVVQDLAGEWTQGEVEGEKYDAGWGASQGYSAMRWVPGAPPVQVRVLRSSDLVTFWPTLDAFEGPEYRRSLVPVMRSGRLAAVANLYECSQCPPSSSSSGMSTRKAERT